MDELSKMNIARSVKGGVSIDMKIVTYTVPLDTNLDPVENQRVYLGQRKITLSDTSEIFTQTDKIGAHNSKSKLYAKHDLSKNPQTNPTILLQYLQSADSDIFRPLEIKKDSIFKRIKQFFINLLKTKTK